MHEPVHPHRHRAALEGDQQLVGAGPDQAVVRRAEQGKTDALAAVIGRNRDDVDDAEVARAVRFQNLFRDIGHIRSQVFAETVLRQDAPMRESEHFRIVVMRQKGDRVRLPRAEPRLGEVAFAEDRIAELYDLAVPARLVASDPHAFPSPRQLQAVSFRSIRASR